MKSISTGTVTFMMMAILFGLGSAYAVRSYLAEPEPATVDVWVAADNLPKYARIQSTNLRALPVPADKVPEGAVTDQGRVTARLVAKTIIAGKPITETDLFPIDGEPSLSDQIPPGKRAVTIAVTERRALAGVLLPDSLVDISLTAATNHPDVEEAMTVTLVRAVKVLATSQQRHRFSENSSRPLRTITVAATPRQANKLILAQQYGRLHVTLCSSLNAETEEAQPVKFTNASEANPLTPREREDAVTPHELLGLGRVPRPITAQIWRGTTVSEVQFQEAQIDESRQATATSQRAVAAEAARRGKPASFDSKQAH